MRRGRSSSQDVLKNLASVVLTVALMALVLYFLPKDIQPISHTPFYSDSTAAAKYQRPQYGYYDDEPKKAAGELFAFDPNTADSTALLRLGLRPWQVRQIYHYRARGGCFSRPEDFARVRGLTVGQYERLRPYIHIGREFREAQELVERPVFNRDSLNRRAKLSLGQTIELNTADTTLLMRVPHIGEFYSWQVVAYRDRLGGFISMDQLDEIDDFPQEAKRFFTLDTTKVKRMNLNRLSVREMSRHPYMNYYQAKAIQNFRRKNDGIDSLAQLRFVKGFTPEDFERLKPYICF